MTEHLDYDTHDPTYVTKPGRGSFDPTTSSAGYTVHRTRPHLAEYEMRCARSIFCGSCR